MAGEAQTTSFMLGTATVMIGTTAQMWDLTVANNSIGLAKNFTISSSPTFTDLTQGAKGSIVYSMMTANTIRAQCEVYEYTSKNLAYGLGLDGSALVPISTSYSLTTAITGNTTTPVTTATFSAASSVVSEFPLGTWVSFQDGDTDRVHYAKLTSAASVTGTGPYVHTLTFANHGFKTGNNMPASAKIVKVNRVEVGSTEEDVYFSAKIIGILPAGNKPIGLLIPKMRIMRGFNLAFASDNYGNMPFEFQPMDLVPTDTNYAEFLDKGPVALFSPT